MDLRSAAQPRAPEIDYLYSLRRGDTHLGLASTRRLLRLLGHPERGVPMLHVGGTNGKGSTTAFAAAMLQAGGLRVGRFTSPHVLRVEERITIGGVPIDPQEFLARVRDLRPFIARAGASFFEAMTGLAAVCFRDAGVEAAVYEVGLGGRLDSTRVVPAQVTVITSIGHDHESILGRGLRAVCREKLGIVRRGVPLFAGFDRPDLVRLAREACRAQRAPLMLVPADVGRVVDLDLQAGMRFELRLPERLELETCLLGAHQVRNAALAALAVRAMRRRGAVSREPDVAGGARAAFMPGRFQVLPAAGRDPLMILDVGHNPEALTATLAVFEAVLPGVRPVVVLGLLRDKRLGPVAERLSRFAARLVLTAPEVERAWDPVAARGQFPAGRGRARVDVVPRVAAAVRQAAELGPGPVVVLGSHYLLGEALLSLAERRGVGPESLLRPFEPEVSRVVA